MEPEELKTICDAVVELTKLRLKECSNLCIENFVPNLLGKMLSEFESDACRHKNHEYQRDMLGRDTCSTCGCKLRE